MGLEFRVNNHDNDDDDDNDNYNNNSNATKTFGGSDSEPWRSCLTVSHGVVATVAS